MISRAFLVKGFSLIYPSIISPFVFRKYFLPKYEGRNKDPLGIALLVSVVYRVFRARTWLLKSTNIMFLLNKMLSWAEVLCWAKKSGALHIGIL